MVKNFHNVYINPCAAKYMKISEVTSIIAAVIILAVVFGFSFVISGDLNSFSQVILFSVLIIIVAVFTKKLVAYMLDSDVEHELWRVYRYSWKPGWHFDKPVPAGIILPLVFTLFSWGILKFSAILTYETRALKYRAAKRFGMYSFSEMTDWHNGIIGASGIIVLLLISVIAYFAPLNIEYLAKMATFYAFWNMIPVSNLDGTQIFFGSRILYTILAVITIIFTFYAFVL